MLKYKKIKNMTRITSCLVLLCLSITISSLAQLKVDKNVSDDDVVKALIGEGVEIVPGSIIPNCPKVARGTFSGESNMGINSGGIILTTGDASLAEGPNNQEGAHLKNLSWAGDDDLEKLIPGFEIMDVCAIEFDFIPEGNSLSFQYVFGSEEYPDFINGDFNDVFGFFVSGPGIDGNGEFSKNAINIATVIDSTSREPVEVSIQTINDGPVKIDMENQCTKTAGPCVNCNEFIFNGNGDDFFNEEWFYNDRFIQYNGFTTILTASIDVIPGETYHMKLSVADAGDSTYDTGVFLAGKSFSTNVPQLTAGGIDGENPYPNAVAGCVDGQFTFTFDEPVSCDVTVEFDVRGSAELSKDYMDFGTSINIPEGSTSESLTVQILDAATGPKTIELYNINVSNETCAKIELDSITLTIEDKPVFSISDEQEIKSGDTATIEATGGFAYEWANAEFTNPEEGTQTVKPSETTEYNVNVSYGRCSEALSTRVTVQPEIGPCELEAANIMVFDCDSSSYNLSFILNGADIGDAVSVTDRNGDEVGTFTKFDNLY